MDSTYEESSADTEVSWEELFDLQNQTLKEIISRVEALENATPAQGSAPAI